MITPPAEQDTPLQGIPRRMDLDIWTLRHLAAYATVDATAYELGAAMGVADCQVEAAMLRLAAKGLVSGCPSLFGMAWEPTPTGLALAVATARGAIGDSSAEAAA